MPGTSHQPGYSQVSRQHVLFLGSAVIFVRFASPLVQNKDCEMRVIFSDSKGGQPLRGCHTLPPLTVRCFDWPLCLGIPSSVLCVSACLCERERSFLKSWSPSTTQLQPLICSSACAGWWHCHSSSAPFNIILLRPPPHPLFFPCLQFKRPTITDLRSSNREGTDLWI